MRACRTESCLAAIVLLALACCGDASQRDSLGIFEDHSDVGPVQHPGAASFDAATGEYTVSGSGYDMWFDRDEFHFLWRRFEGDLAMQADIEFVGQGAHERRKAALMVRQSLAPDSAYADAAVHEVGMVAIQRRAEEGGDTDHIEDVLEGPWRTRLERRGDHFTMWLGPKGGELEKLGELDVLMGDPVYVGLAVSAHEASALETAIFSNLTLETEF